MTDPITSTCETCGTAIAWIDLPFDAWWAHKIHPSDGHDAVTSIEIQETADDE